MCSNSLHPRRKRTTFSGITSQQDIASHVAATFPEGYPLWYLLKTWFFSNRKPEKFWQWFLWKHNRLYGAWVTVLLYGCTCIALDFLRQPPGTLAQLCRTAALWKDTYAKPAELWPYGIMSVLLSLVHLLSLHRALNWYSNSLSGLGAGQFNMSLAPPFRVQVFSSVL